MSRSTTEIIGPSSHFYVSQRLRIHYVDWGNEDAPTLVLVHGGRDHARSWDWVARELRRDYHVVALDLRGHGDSAWAIAGGYNYHDYMLDLAQLIEMLGRHPVALIGHSLGGGICLYYAGTFPERVSRVVSIEGLGIPYQENEKLHERPVPERMERFITGSQGYASRTPRGYPSIEAATRRVLEANSFLSEAQAQHLTLNGVARDEDGTYSWKFDNYLRKRGLDPIRFTDEQIFALWSNINLPVLLVRGSEGWMADPEKNGRLAKFPDGRCVTVEGAEHWVHHDKLDEFLRLVRRFLGSTEST